MADPVKLATDPAIDVFVELIGGEGDPARAAVTAALKAGKSVVTANKALLASHGVALATLAEKHKVALNFEAAVGGAIPIVKTLREGLAGNSIARVYGILNGTCNYILTRMEQEKLSFDDCLKEAQRLGYAEADPSFDVDGHDTAQKLAILASLTFGIQVDPKSIYVEGISSIAPADLEAADELGYRVKLLGVAVQDRQGHRAARAPDHGAQGFRHRAGDGRHQRRHHRRRGHRADHAGRAGRRRHGDRLGGGLRHRRHRARRARRAVRPAGRRGSPPARRRRCSATRAATTSGCWRSTSRAPPRPSPSGWPQQHISMESIVQRHREPAAGAPARPSGAVPVILITYATTEDAVRKALAAVKRDKVISGEPQLIRIEKN